MLCPPPERKRQHLYLNLVNAPSYFAWVSDKNPQNFCSCNWRKNLFHVSHSFTLQSSKYWFLRVIWSIKIKQKTYSIFLINLDEVCSSIPQLCLKSREKDLSQSKNINFNKKEAIKLLSSKQNPILWNIFKYVLVTAGIIWHLFGN